MPACLIGACVIQIKAGKRLLSCGLEKCCTDGAQGGSDDMRGFTTVLCARTVMRAKDRCGWCNTCLRPAMKKACLTRRAEMHDMAAAAMQAD